MILGAITNISLAAVLLGLLIGLVDKRKNIALILIGAGFAGLILSFILLLKAL